MARLEDKVALITGGESGIGLATARLVVVEGARVHLIGIDEGKLEAAVGELGAERASSAVADVTDEDALAFAVAAGVERHGRCPRRSRTPCCTSPPTRARWSRHTRSRSTAG